MESSMCAVDMTSKTINAEENKAKKLKLSPEEDSESECNAVSDEIPSLRVFKIQKVLFEDSSSKCIFLEANFEETDDKAVLIFEKEPFSRETVEKILTDETVLVRQFDNDIYSKFQAFPKAELNGIQITAIHPATDKHIEKYQFHARHLVRETAEIYRDVVAPYLVSKQFSLQWVYNILEYKSEVDRLIFDDLDPEIGFVLLPDLKWNEADINNLYVIAICRQKHIKSLRDLDASHLPLLKNIWEKSTDVLEKKYKLSKSKLRAYLHYQPSYYHLHIHFTNIEYNAPGSSADRAHLLDSVIHNLENFPDYYKNAVLVYAVKENDSLYDKLKDAEVFDRKT